MGDRIGTKQVGQMILAEGKVFLNGAETESKFMEKGGQENGTTCESPYFFLNREKKDIDACIRFESTWAFPSWFIPHDT